ncbi:MAG: hypothetical protein V1778_02180 [bacterium]
MSTQPWWKHRQLYNVLSFGRQHFPFRFWVLVVGWVLWILVFAYLYFWRVRVGVPAQLFFILFCLLLYPLVQGYRWFDRSARHAFWKETATALGWRYEPTVAVSESQGVIFQRGRDRKSTNVLTGTLIGRPMQIFEYEYSEYVGDSTVRFRFLVLLLTFKGSFPHLYLDRLKNGRGNVVGEHIPLPTEFEKKFALYAPREYEMEALQIFTPDLLQRILDLGIPYDVEFANGNLCIVIQGSILDKDVLKERLALAEKIVHLFGRVLDRASFTPITGRPTGLRHAPADSLRL